MPGFFCLGAGLGGLKGSIKDIKIGPLHVFGRPLYVFDRPLHVFGRPLQSVSESLCFGSWVMFGTPRLVRGGPSARPG